MLDRIKETVLHFVLVKLLICTSFTAIYSIIIYEYETEANNAL